MTAPRWLGFFLVIFGMSAAIHGYLWFRLVASPGWPERYSKFGAVVLILGALGIPLSFLSSRTLPPAVAKPIAAVLFGWMGVMFLLFCWSLAGEFARFGHGAFRRMVSAPLDETRRLFVERALATVAFFGTGVMGSYGLASALGIPPVKRVGVTLSKLGQGLSGLRLVQMTDIHVGSQIGKEFVQGLVEKVNALEPDIVAITGDLVDGSVEHLGEAVGALGNLRAKEGVYFVTGNHEYYSGADPWIEFLTNIGIRVLRNERVTISRDGARLELVGIDDYTAHHFGGDHGADLKKALDGRDPEAPSVLLAHQPKAFAEAKDMGVDLQVSGHTHGGQIFPFNFLARLEHPFVAGLHASGESQIYVSCGTGFWGPPMRVGAPSEITLLELRGPDRSSEFALT